MKLQVANRVHVILCALILFAAGVALLAGGAAPAVGGGPSQAGMYEIAIPGVYVGDDRYLMPMSDDLPFGAIGYLDNGCTATLIDSRHILSAAHCFTFDGPTDWGDWQEPLYFFPNYHPDRQNPPYVLVERAVVGSRVGTGGEFLASDWGIGYLAEEVTGFPSMQIASTHPAFWPGQVMFAGYARDYKWHPLPFPPPYQGFCPNFGPNCRWTHALVDEDCTVLQDNDDNLVLDLASCKVQGGNSGSPIIRNLGGDNDPVYRIAGVIHGGWAAPATARFEHAPRFAANVAVASRDDGSGLAQVFVSDPDVDFIARREREEPSAYGDFGNFAPIFNLTDPGRLTAFRQPDNRPQIVVIAGFVSLYTTYVDPSGAWVSYVEMNGPKGVPVYRDIDSALDAAGNPQLYLAGSDGFIYTRRKETANPLDWRPWELLTDANDFTRVTAVRRLDGSQQVFMYTADGQVFTMYQLTPSANSDWSQAAPFDHAGYLPQLEDLDVSLRDDGGLDVFAVAYADGGLWKRGTFGPEPGSGWSLVWSEWDVPLYTPNVNTDHYIEGLMTLTADLWPEEDGDDLVPVVFATDSRGNVYFTTYDIFMGWQRWRSFYD